MIELRNYGVVLTAHMPRCLIPAEHERLASDGFRVRAQAQVIHTRTDEVGTGAVYTITSEIKAFGMRDACQTTMNRVETNVMTTLGMQDYEWRVAGVTAQELV